MYTFLRGVVFDFNGTLFWDTPLHNEAWDLFMKKHGIHISETEKNEKIPGKNNHDIMRAIYPGSLSDSEIASYIAEKESLYQTLCLKTDMQLAPGAADLLNFLKIRGIPRAIATASGIENVDFYFKHLNLACFFDRSTVVYNDGNMPSKPDPQVFQKAIHALGIRSDETLVFEDSWAGIRAAENAGAGQIIIVDSYGRDYRRWHYQKIKNFDEVDRQLFYGKC